MSYKARVAFDVTLDYDVIMHFHNFTSYIVNISYNLDVRFLDTD